MALESSIGEVRDLIVGLDVLLDSLATVEVWSAQALRGEKNEVTRITSTTSKEWTNLDPLRSFNCRIRRAC